MSKDLANLLEGWEFDPSAVHVRIIRGDDGREKIQLRVELGVLQMELDGRPDGRRPEEHESWLDYYEERCRIHQSSEPDSEPFVLHEDDLARLWREGVQYYHRYLSFWHLERYELCARDTARNLRLFAFVRDYATQDRHKMQFDQWRPYVTAMYARAVATPILQRGAVTEALQHIEAGIDAIREFLEEYGQTHRAEECEELVELERWRENLLSKQEEQAAADPSDPLTVLRQRLQTAISAEEFEEAAGLRDEIRRLSGEAGKP